MYIINDICYADELVDNIKITDAVSLGHGILLITFSTGEKRLFDVTELKGSAFEPLKKDEILNNIQIFHGILTWNDGDIDIAPETVYQMSIAYSPKDMAM